MGKLLRVVNRDHCIGCYSCMFACSRTWFQVISIEKAALRVKNYPGAEGAFSIRPCYGCFDPDCSRACPSGALKPRPDGGVDFEGALCTHCRSCVSACVPGALQWDHDKAVPIVCHQCGVCVKFCPSDVLDMVEIPRGGN